MQNFGEVSGFSSTEAGTFEQLSVLTGEFYGMVSRLFSMRLRETVNSMSSALSSGQRPESEVQGGVAGTSVLNERKWVQSSKR